MAGPSTQFKKLLLEHDRGSRDRILYKLSNWVFEQHPMDPLAAQCSSVLQQLCNDNGYQSEMAFQTNPKWYVLLNSDQCVSLQQIVDAKLAIPVPPPPAIPVSTSCYSKTNSWISMERPFWRVYEWFLLLLQKDFRSTR